MRRESNNEFCKKFDKEWIWWNKKRASYIQEKNLEKEMLKVSLLILANKNDDGSVKKVTGANAMYARVHYLDDREPDISLRDFASYVNAVKQVGSNF